MVQCGLVSVAKQKVEIRESYLHTTYIRKVEIILEQREVAFLSPSKICENLNFSREILLGDKNATYLCSKIISTLKYLIRVGVGK